MTAEAPPGRSGALTDAGRSVGRAAFGGTLAFIALVAVSQLLALVQFLLVGAYGLWSWVKIGLLTALLSLRADVVATVQGPPAFQTAAESETLRLRLVPMVLTIGFLWVAARAGRRAAQAWPDRSAVVASGLAAAGAAVPVAILSAACSSLVSLFFPSVGLRLRVDVSSAALWAGTLAAVGAGVGAYLEAAHGRAAAAALRGALTAYGWALVLVAVGVFVLATLEPTVTRAYVDEVTGLGSPGGAFLGYHLLAFPTQSALLLAPASGSCLEVVGENPIFELCPWRLVPGPSGELFVQDPLPLSPWLWLLSGVPLVAAMLGGARAVTGTMLGRPRAVGLGVAAGLTFAVLAVLGAWFAAPQLSPIVVPVQISVHPAWMHTAITAMIWGAVGGAFGAWLAARRYEEPELPRPTSA